MKQLIVSIVIMIIPSFHGRMFSSLSRFSAPELKTGVSFTGAGLLTPFHIGASQYLKNQKVISDSTTIAGSSGGALAAVTTALNVKASESLEACVYVGNECKSKGTRATLRLALDEVFEDILPKNSADLLKKRAGSIRLAYTEIYPRIRSCVVSEFETKQDLCSVLRASCNIPFYFNGNQISVSVRGAAGIDGFFALTLSRFGAPPTDLPREVIVCPFPPTVVGLRPVPKVIAEANLDEEYTASLNQRIDIISPSLLEPNEWLLSTLENVQLAFLPPSDALVDTLVNRLKYEAGLGRRTLQNREMDRCLIRCEKRRDIDLVYTHLYNCGVIAASRWMQQSLLEV